MRINHNIAALNTYRQLSSNNTITQKSLEKLSSGMRINRAGDDAAGLAISEKMRGQIRGLEQASRNAQDGISFIQTAEGALNETHSILQRMRELAVQSSNDTNTDTDRAEIQKEIDQLAKELTRIANDTEFNTQTLLNGGITEGNLGEVNFHIGANEGQKISLSINAMDAESLGVARDVKTGELDATNTAGVASVGADSVDVAKTLVDGDYKVTVTTVTAGVTADMSVSGDLADAGSLVSGGIPTADFSVTFTYKAEESATASSTQTSGTSGNISLTDPTTYTGADATWVLATSDGTNFTLDKGDGSGPQAITFTSGKVTVDGLELDTSLITATSGDEWTINLTGATAASWTASGDDTGTYTTSDTVTINGVDIDLSQVSNADTDNEAFSVTGYAADGATVQLFQNDGTTEIGNAVAIDLTNGGTYTIGDTVTGQLKVTFGAGDATAGTTTVTVSTQDSKAAALKTDGTMSNAETYGGINVSTQSDASKAITIIQNAIETVSAERSKLGAYQNRLEHTINNLGTSAENLTAAESRIRDVDMAKEMMEFTKNSILSQAAQAMLAQANQQPQGVLQLLR
jgi:flagellin